MQDTETVEATQRDRGKREPEDGCSNEEVNAAGPWSDAVMLIALIGASVRDAARLAGLETRLIVKTVGMMVVLGTVLGLVIAGIWLSIALIVVTGLYEFTDLGMTLSVATAALINVVCAGALFVVLKRLARRLAFPQTRLAVQILLDDASRSMHQQE